MFGHAGVAVGAGCACRAGRIGGQGLGAAAHYFCIVWFEPNFKLIQKDLKMSLKMLERKRKTGSFSLSHPF